MKTLYNSTALDCALELLYRTRGVKLDRDFATITLEYVSPTQSRLVITAKAQADDGRKGIYTGTQTFLFDKKNLTAILPTFLVYGSVYPTSYAQLKQYLKATYDIVLDEQEFALVGTAGEPPLTNTDVLGVPLDGADKFYLKTTTRSGRFPPGQVLAIQVAQPVDDAYPQLQAGGNAPNAILGQDYDFQYTVTGGKPEYRWEVISGTPPRPLNSTGRFIGPVLNSGALEWVVRVRDDRGFFVDIQDSAQVDVAALTIEGEFADSIVSAPIDVQLTALGGQGPYKFYKAGGFTADLTLSEAGRVQGQLDGGAYVLDIEVRDVMGRSTVRRFEFNVLPRTIAQVTQSLLAKMLSWYTFDENTFDSGEIVRDLHAHANMAFFGDAQGVVGKRGVALRLAGSRAEGVANAHDIDKAFSFAMAVRDLPGDSSRYLLGKWAADAGWAISTTDDGSGRVQLDYEAGGHHYNFLSTAEAFDGSWRHLIVDRADALATNQVKFFVDNVLGGKYDTTREPVTQNTQYRSVIGARSDGQGGSNFTGDLDEMGIFSDRLWSDERAYLFNNGSMRSYWQIQEDAGLLQPYAQPTLTGAPPAAAEGQQYSFEFVIGGGHAPYKNARIVSGTIPSGTSLTIVDGTKVRLSGLIASVGLHDFTLVVNDMDDRPAVIQSQLAVGASAGNTARWNTGDLAQGVQVDGTELVATTTLNGPLAQRGMVRSNLHVAVPCYFELEMGVGINTTGDVAIAGVVDGRFNPAQSMSAQAQGLSVAMPSRNIYHNGALLGQLGGESLRVGIAVDPVSRKVWLKSTDVSSWFNGGNPTSGTLPTATLAGNCPILAAAEPYTPGVGSVTLGANPMEVGAAPQGFEKGLIEHASVISMLHLNEAVGTTAFTDAKGVVWSNVGGVAIAADAKQLGGRGLLIDDRTKYLQTELTALDLTSGPFAVEFFLHVQAAVAQGNAVPILHYGEGVEGDDGFGLSLFTQNGTSRQLILRNAYSNMVSVPYKPVENERNHVLITRCPDGFLRVCLNGTSWSQPLRQGSGGKDPRTFVQGRLKLGTMFGDWLLNAPFTASELRVTKGSTVYSYNKPFVPPNARFA